MKYRHILRCSLTALGLLAFAASMFCPVYGIETGTESRIYTCGDVLAEGVLAFPKDVARLVVTGETHYRMVWLLLDLLLFSSAYSVLRGSAGRKMHVAMFIAVITIICFYLWSPDYGWAWDWSEGTMTRKLYGYHLWLAGFVSVYAAVALERYCRGKEEDSGSGLYDFSARFLNPVAGRFLTLDPAAGETPSLSPYLYCAANPLNVVDPDGRHLEVRRNEDGTYTIEGGQANSDRNIYLNYGTEGQSVIGTMLTEYSFMNDEGKPVEGAVIDMGIRADRSSWMILGDVRHGF